MGIFDGAGRGSLHHGGLQVLNRILQIVAHPVTSCALNSTRRPRPYEYVPGSPAGRRLGNKACSTCRSLRRTAPHDPRGRFTRRMCAFIRASISACRASIFARASATFSAGVGPAAPLGVRGPPRVSSAVRSVSSAAFSLGGVPRPERLATPLDLPGASVGATGAVPVEGGFASCASASLSASS